MFHVKHAAVPDLILSAAAVERLRVFVAFLLRWNDRINLIAAADWTDVWHRHVLDSAQLGPLLPTTGDIVDLGSGGGFPGLVLAIVTGRHVHLIEADRRKGIFLREAVRLLGASADVHIVRAEYARLAPAAAVVARAVAPLPRLLRLAVPLLGPGGVCVFPKGRTVADELTAARREWHMQIDRFPSRTDPAATLLRLREISRVPPNR